MLHSLTNTTSQTRISPVECQSLVKKYFFTLPRFRRFAKQFDTEPKFKVALKNHLNVRNATFDDAVPPKELKNHLHHLLAYSRQLELFWTEKISF